MASTASLWTERLLLRRWRLSDRGPFAAMNADPEVMRYFPATLAPDRSDALIDRIEAGFGRYGFGLWALEVAGTGEFIGFTGLSVPAFDAHFTPAVEIGWRLARPSWGYGYATEAARRVLASAFADFGLDGVVSFTSLANVRSQAVMRRIGMTHDPADDFDHPRLPPGHRLTRHVLWRLPASRWRNQQATLPRVAGPGQEERGGQEQHAGDRDRDAGAGQAGQHAPQRGQDRDRGLAGDRPRGQRAGRPVRGGLVEPVGGEHRVEHAAAHDQAELDRHDQHEPGRAGADEGQPDRPAGAQRPGGEHDPVPPEPGDEPAGRP